MCQYIIKRLLQTIVVLFFVSVFSFLLIRIAPGNPALMMLPDTATEEQIAEMEAKLGLDQPLVIQYIKYITGVLHGDLGMSTTYRVPVIDVIPDRLLATGKLTIATVICGCLISIPLGIIAGSHRGSIIDFVAMLFALLGQSMSPVWLAVLNVYIFSVALGWLPSMGTGGFEYIILPMATLAYPMAAETTRIARSGMIDTLSEDYITSAFAKGIRKSVVCAYTCCNIGWSANCRLLSGYSYCGDGLRVAWNWSINYTSRIQPGLCTGTVIIVNFSGNIYNN